MTIFILAALTALLALVLFACRFMPFEIGARIVPKRWARFFYGEPFPKK